MERLTDKEIREKLVSRGVKSLEDAELLSIILGDAGAGHSAADTASKILEDKDNSLLQLSRTDMPQLRMSGGIGVKRAAVLAAVFEFSERLRREEAAVPFSIRGKDDVVSIFGPALGKLKHEEMWALYLTSANGVIEKTRVSQGGTTAIIVDYKLVVKRAVETLASSIIIVHNHPSGVSAPSPEDISITTRVAQAAGLFDISLVDHIIITDGSSYSFRQNGLIK